MYDSSLGYRNGKCKLKSKSRISFLARVVEYLKAHNLNPETECVNAPPRDNLLPYAAEYGADLIVLGNSAKSLLLRKILGETALHVMRSSDRMLFLAQ